MSQIIQLVPTSGPGSGTVTSITFNGGLTSTPDPVTTTGTATIDQTNLTVLDGTVYWDTGTQLLHTTATGTAGEVLTSAGAGLPPIYAAIPSQGIHILTADDAGTATGQNVTISGGTTGLTTTASSATMDLTGTLKVNNGGTNTTSFSTYGVVVSGSSSTSALAALSLSSGQIVIGGTTTPAAATLTAGTGVTITNGNNTITISAGGGGFTWNDVTGGSATMAAENGYIADSGSLTTLTMPTNNAFGDTIKVVGKGSGGWKIVTGLLQNIIFGSSASTATTGNISSTNANDCIELVCTTASITAPLFTVVSSIGSPSIT